MERKLNYIRCVAEHGSILKAAKQLYITPSALSKYIQKTESEYGIKIFDRVGKKFVLTYAGERFLESLQHILSLHEEMRAELNDLSKTYRGRLRVGYLPNNVDETLYDILPAFKERFPSVNLEFYEDTSQNIRKKLLDHQLDLAIIPDVHIPENLKCEFLTRDYWVVVLPKGHPAIQYTVRKKEFRFPWIDISLLEKEQFILPAAGRFTDDLLDKLEKECDFTPAHTIHVQGFGTILKFITHGLGISISSEQIAKANARNSDIILLSFGKNEFIHNLVITYNMNHYLDYPMRTFIELYKNARSV